MGSERVCLFAVVFLIAGAVGDRLLHHASTKRPLHQEVVREFSLRSNVSLPHAKEDIRILEHLHKTHPEHFYIDAHKEQFELLNKNLDSLKDNLSVLRGRIDLLQNYLTLHINNTESNATTSAVTDKIKSTLSSLALPSTLSTKKVEPVNTTSESTTIITSTHHDNLSVLHEHMINESLSSEKNVSKRNIDTVKPLTILTGKAKQAGTKPLRKSPLNSSIPETFEIQANKSIVTNGTSSLKSVDPDTLWTSFATIIDSVAALKRMMDDNIWSHNRGVMHVLRGHPLVEDGQEFQNMDPVSGRALCNELLRKLDSMIESDGHSEGNEDLTDNYEHEAARMLVDSFVRVLDATFALKTIMDSRAQKRAAGISAVTPTGDAVMSVNEEIISTHSSQEDLTATSMKGQSTSSPLVNKQANLANLSSALAGSATEAEAKAGTSESSPKTPTSKNISKSTTVRKNAKGVSVKKPHANISDLGHKEISTEKLGSISNTVHPNNSTDAKETLKSTLEVNKSKGKIHHEMSPTGAENKIKQNVTMEGVPASTKAPVEHEATRKQSTAHLSEHEGVKRHTSAISLNGTVLYSTQNEESKDNSQTTSIAPNLSEATNLTTHIPKDSLENMTTSGELNISSTDESAESKVKRAVNTTNSPRRRVRVDRSSSTENESLKMKSFVDSLETLLEDILDTHNLKRDVSNMLGLNEYSDEPISFPLSLENDTTEGGVVDTETTAVKVESSSEVKTETSPISAQNVENITLIANHTTPEILETASIRHGNHSLEISSSTEPDQDVQKAKSEQNATLAPGPTEYLENETTKLHSEEKHENSPATDLVLPVDITEDELSTVEHDYYISEENVSQTVVPQSVKGRRMKSNIHGEFQTLDNNELQEAVYKPEKTKMAEKRSQADEVYGAGVNSAYVATVTVPSFLGLLVFSLLCCFCLRNSSWCCRLFKEQPASHVYLVEEHSTE